MLFHFISQGNLSYPSLMSDIFSASGMFGRNHLHDFLSTRVRRVFTIFYLWMQSSVRGCSRDKLPESS